MRGGTLRNEIAIYELAPPTHHPDTNEPIEKWRRRTELYAEVIDLKAKEFQEGSQRFERTATRFSCRFYDILGVTETMQVKYNGKTYRITGIRQDHQSHNRSFIDAELIQ
jgi:SPP1 family predicted phage head-tail adaptor